MLNQILSGSMSTLITLEMNAANITFSTYLGKGKIISASISNFESKSGNGYLNCVVQNNGNYSAEFILSFNCTSNVNPISAAKLYISSLASYNYSSPVTVINDTTVNNNNCTTTLKNEIGTILDSVTVTFNTTAITTSSRISSNTYLFNYFF